MSGGLHPIFRLLGVLLCGYAIPRCLPGNAGPQVVLSPYATGTPPLVNLSYEEHSKLMSLSALCNLIRMPKNSHHKAFITPVCLTTARTEHNVFTLG
jgi:hypothetical protein